MDVWGRVDALIDRAPSEHDLQSHRLELLAARRFRQLDRRVPEDFAAAERFSAVALLSVPVVLERMRKAYDGPAIIFKGPEVAAEYPDPILRSFGDLDLLVADPPAVSRALRAAGFEEVGEPELYVDIHHIRPLAIPGIPLPIELHSVPKWIEGRTPPPVGELFEAAVPSSSGFGLSTLAPEQHVLVLAAHSWAHEPLRRLRDMVDIAALLDDADLGAVAALARRWAVGRLWATTLATVEALFGDRPTPWALRLWAQNLDRARERTVLENHTQRWLSDFWVLPPPVSLRRLPRRFASEFGPAGEDGGWRAKLLRTRLAVSNASRPRSQHDRDLAGRDR